MKSLKSINVYFFKYKWQLLLGALFVVLSSLFSIYQGVIVRNATNEIYKLFEKQSVVNSNVFVKHGVMLFVFALISGFFLFLMRQTLIVMSRNIEFDQKNELYAHFQSLDFNFYKKNKTGDLMTRISEDVGKVRMYVGPALMYLVNTFVTITTVIAYMLKQSMSLTLVVLLPLPV